MNKTLLFAAIALVALTIVAFDERGEEMAGAALISGCAGFAL